MHCLKKKGEKKLFCMTVIDTRSRLKMIQLPQSMHSFQMTAKKVAGKHTNTPQCELAMVLFEANVVTSGPNGLITREFPCLCYHPLIPQNTLCAPHCWSYNFSFFLISPSFRLAFHILPAGVASVALVERSSFTLGHFQIHTRTHWSVLSGGDSKQSI